MNYKVGDILVYERYPNLIYLVRVSHIFNKKDIQVKILKLLQGDAKYGLICALVEPKDFYKLRVPTEDEVLYGV